MIPVQFLVTSRLLHCGLRALFAAAALATAAELVAVAWG